MSMLDSAGTPVLTNFGQMQVANEGENHGWCMSDLYRAPEILFGLPWGFPVDIWALGVMTLELLEGRNLFDPVDRTHQQYLLPSALSQYIAYLGLPPLEMIRQSPAISQYFDENGSWISQPAIPKTSFEDFVTAIPSGEEKELFLKFIRKILTCDPVVRATSSEIIPDEWLMRPMKE